MQGDIAFTSDIVTEVAKRLQLPKEKIEIVVTIIVEYIHHIAELTDFAAISLPKIGVLHLKRPDCVKNIKNFSSKTQSTAANAEDRFHAYNNKLVDIEEHIQMRRDKGKSIGSRHGVVRRIRNFFYTGGRSIKEIEKIQNQVYEENIKD